MIGREIQTALPLYSKFLPHELRQHGYRLLEERLDRYSARRPVNSKRVRPESGMVTRHHREAKQEQPPQHERTKQLRLPWEKRDEPSLVA